MKAKLIVNNKEIEVEISEEELNKLQEKKTGYERVGEGNTYYFESGCGEVRNFNDKDPDDDMRYENANYYSSEKVAENNARTDRLMRQLRRFAAEHRKKEIIWNNQDLKYIIRYAHSSPKLYVDSEMCGRNFGTIAFDTEETAQLAIETFHDELIWYFTEYKDSL